MNISELIIFISSACNLLIALGVLLKKPKSFVHQSFFVSILGIVTWSAGFASLRLVDNTHSAIQITLFGGLVWVAFLYLFSRAFPDQHRFKLRHPLVFGAPLVAASILIFSDLVIHDVDFSFGFTNPRNAELFPLFALCIMVYLSLSLYALYTSFRQSRGVQRSKMRYVCLGLFLFILSTLIFDVLLPAFGVMHLNTLGPLSSLLLGIAIAYAILRHQLMDIRIVIQKGLIYLTLFLGISLAYVTLLSVLHSRFLHLDSYQAPVISGIVLTLLGIVTVPWIDQYLRNITDSIFFKDRYHYAEALKRLSKALHETVDLETLLEESSQHLCDIFRSTKADYLFSTNKFMSACTTKVLLSHSGTKLFVPVVFKEEFVATLVVSEKKSGDAFSAEDIQLLETFSYHIAIALEKARLLKEVQDYSRKLEDKVNERTREIHELLQRQEATLLDISHNLQTPLTVVKTELSSLEDQLPSSYVRSLKVFERSIDTISAFITKLLHFSRRSMGIQGNHELFDLSLYLNEVFEYISVVAENNGVSPSLECSSSVMIEGNKKDIEELINNIVSNAIKYRRQKSYSLMNISLQRSKGFAVLSVWDNGVGIPRKDIKKIFQRFYRTESTSKVSGTGLGLAICQKIAEAHHGDIKIESLLGSWTLCTVRIPLATFSKNQKRVQRLP